MGEGTSDQMALNVLISKMLWFGSNTQKNSGQIVHRQSAKPLVPQRRRRLANHKGASTHEQTLRHTNNVSQELEAGPLAEEDEVLYKLQLVQRLNLYTT